METEETNNGESTSIREADAIISAKELLALKIPDPTWAVDGLFPEGATLLAGEPKIGKSFLALNLACAVAGGWPALGSYDVTQGPVYYLALEDTKRRLHERMTGVLNGRSAPRDFDFLLESPQMGNGGIRNVQKWMEAVNGPRLVVIDTFGHFRGQRASRDVYQSDNQAVSRIKKMVDEYGASALIIHHTNKREVAPSSFHKVSGSTGLTGAADTVALMHRDRTRADARLSVAGRDIEQKDIGLTFDQSTMSWAAAGTSGRVASSAKRQRVMDHLAKEGGGPLAPKEVSEALSLKSANCRQLMGRMVESGELAKDDYGEYSLPEEL